jgi:hypothetical protein
MKTVLATILGLIASFAVNYIIILLFMRMDASVDLNDPIALAEFMKDFTAIDYMIPLSAHLFGVLAGLLTARAICKTSTLPIVIIMTLHMAATVLSLIAIPHPVWFAIIDVIGPLLLFIPIIKLYKR